MSLLYLFNIFTRMTEPTLIVPPSGAVTAHCLRLRPGDRLMSSLKQAASIILSRIPKEECGSCFWVRYRMLQ